MWDLQQLVQFRRVLWSLFYLEREKNQRRGADLLWHRRAQAFGLWQNCTGWISRQGSRAMRPSSFLALTMQGSPFLSLMRMLTRPTKCQYSPKLQQNFTGPLQCADLTSAPWGPTDTQLYNMPQPRWLSRAQELGILKSCMVPSIMTPKISGFLAFSPAVECGDDRRYEIPRIGRKLPKFPRRPSFYRL